MPIVAFGAPIGAKFINGRSKQVILGALAVCAIVQYVATIVLVPIYGAPLKAAQGCIVFVTFVFGCYKGTKFYMDSKGYDLSPPTARAGIKVVEPNMGSKVSSVSNLLTDVEAGSGRSSPERN